MKLLPLDDPRWNTYHSGYREAFDTVALIRELQRGGFSESFWATVWSDLHHQGDVGEASYAIIAYLVEYQSSQPELDEQLFHFALRKLPVLGVEKMRRGCAPDVVMGVASVIALAAGQRLLARAYLDFAPEAAAAFLENEYGYKP